MSYEWDNKKPTAQMLVKPEKYDFHVTSQDAQFWASKIYKDLKK